MDNAVISGSNVNDFNAVETLRRDAINANENEKANENNPAIQYGDTDSVELSEESVILSGLNADNLTSGGLTEPLTRAVEDTSLETGTANRIPNTVEENPENTIINTNTELTGALATGNEPGTETETNVPIGTTGITAAEENVTRAVETVEAAEEEANMTTERPDDVLYAARTEETAAGLAAEAAQREPLAETENMTEENAVPMEVQANRLSQLNAALNNAYTFTEGAAVSNTEGASEAQRNEQQTLLQNVGSQLAQVVPPSSILSVVG
jgi:hypothetical protein